MSVLVTDVRLLCLITTEDEELTTDCLLYDDNKSNEAIRIGLILNFCVLLTGFNHNNNCNNLSKRLENQNLFKEVIVTFGLLCFPRVLSETKQHIGIRPP